MAKEFESLIVVNMLAGPGAGKTQLAQSTCAALLRLGINCQLVDEVAKGYIFSGDLDTLDNQPFITTCQFQELYRLAGSVDVAVTDTSLLLGSVRSKDWVPDAFYPCIQGLYNLFDNVNIWVNRPPESTYSEVGRTLDVEAAIATDLVIRQMITDWGIHAIEVNAGDWIKVVQTVLERLRIRGKYG